MLEDLGLFGIEKRQLQENVRASCPYLQGGHQEDKSRLLETEHGGRTRDHGCKAKRASEQIFGKIRTVRH